MTTQPRSEPAHCSRWLQEVGFDFDVDEVHADLRHHGCDLRRSMFVTYLIASGANRRTAEVLRRRAAADGWQASLYADQFAWVVRLCRVGPPTRSQLSRDYRYVLALAREHDANVRGVIIEELRGGDVWEVLAARVVAGATTATEADAEPKASAHRRDQARRDAPPSPRIA